MPVGGVLADKLNKVRTMYITDYIRGITIGLAALAVLWVNDSQVMLIILFAMNAILSINSSLFNPASGSLLRFIVKMKSYNKHCLYARIK
jgi:nitrate/nitrite transporter NarK